jgi:hypothetical protein
MDSRRKQIEQGQAVRGRLPAWLTWSDELNKPVLDEPKAAVVRRVFSLSLAGRGCRAIRDAMIESGTPPISNHTRSSWSEWFVHRLLVDESVLGFHKGTHAKVFPAVISEADFYASKSRLEKRKHLTVSQRSQNSNLFTGLIKCSRCGHSMVRQQTKARGHLYRHLLCGGYLRHRSDCRFHAIKYGLVEDSVLNLLAQTDLINLVLSGGHKPSEMENLKAQLAATQAQAAKFLSLISGDPSPSPRLVAELKKAEALEAFLADKINEENARRTATPTAVSYRRFQDEFAAYAKVDDHRAAVRTAIAEVIDGIVMDIENRTYEVRLRDACQSINVNLCKHGWSISPAPAWLFGRPIPQKSNIIG